MKGLPEEAGDGGRDAELFEGGVKVGRLDPVAEGLAEDVKDAREEGGRDGTLKTALALCRVKLRLLDLFSREMGQHKLDDGAEVVGIDLCEDGDCPLYLWQDVVSQE